VSGSITPCNHRRQATLSKQGFIAVIVTAGALAAAAGFCFVMYPSAYDTDMMTDRPEWTTHVEDCHIRDGMNVVQRSVALAEMASVGPASGRVQRVQL